MTMHGKLCIRPAASISTQNITAKIFVEFISEGCILNNPDFRFSSLQVGDLCYRWYLRFSREMTDVLTETKSYVQDSDTKEKKVIERLKDSA
jgi:hypothetical protein